MAKSRPGLGGIFRLKGKHEASVKLTSLSTYGHADKSNRNNNALGDNQFTSFTQFGNYRPKILGDPGNDPIAGISNGTKDPSKSFTPEPTQPSTSGESLTKTTTRHSSSGEDPGGPSTAKTSQQTQPQSSNRDPKPSVKKGLKTKSSKNFILMGDKDTPIVLQRSGNGSDDEHPKEMAQGQGQVEDASSLMEQVLTFGEENSPAETVPQSPTSVNSNNTDDDVFDTETVPGNTPYPEAVAHVVNGNVSGDGSIRDGNGTEKAMPYIPPPDYDEDVMTMDISDEDDNQSNPVSSQAVHSPRRVYRVYQGDDFGQYLKDEDSMFTSPTSRTKTRYKKSTPRSSQKKNKPPNKNRNKNLKGTLTKALFGSQHKDKVEENAKRHTIHEFSFGHSKIGLGDSAGIPKGVWKNGQAQNGFAQQTRPHGQGNYELFLSSRQSDHKKSGSLESTSDHSGNEAGEDNNNSTSPRKYHMTNPAYSTPNKYVKSNGLWQKLTLRFRRRSRGELGTVN